MGYTLISELSELLPEWAETDSVVRELVVYSVDSGVKDSPAMFDWLLEKHNNDKDEIGLSSVRSVAEKALKELKETKSGGSFSVVVYYDTGQVEKPLTYEEVMADP